MVDFYCGLQISKDKSFPIVTVFYEDFCNRRHICTKLLGTLLEKFLETKISVSEVELFLNITACKLPNWISK